MSSAPQLEDDSLTARASVAATEIVEGLRFATIEEAQRILAAGIPSVGPGAIAKLTDLIKQKAAAALMQAAYSTTTEAIAKGRTESAQIYADEIALVEYSALLDNATCDACRSADGKVVKMGSAEYARLQPPNRRCRGRRRCRCVFIYVLKDEPSTGPTQGPDGGPPKLAPIIPLFPKPQLALPAPKIVPISASPIPLKPKLPPTVTTTPTGLPPIPLGPTKPIVVAQPAPKARATKGPQVTPGYRDDVAKKSSAFIARGESDDQLGMRAGAWDLFTDDQPPRLVRTLDELRRAIGENGQPANDAAIRRFLQLPAAEAMPARLADELRRHYSR